MSRLVTILSDCGLIFCGMFAMGIVWFINDNGKNSPYLRGFRDGYRIAKMEKEGEQHETD